MDGVDDMEENVNGDEDDGREYTLSEDVSVVDTDELDLSYVSRRCSRDVALLSCTTGIGELLCFSGDAI
jgi:hypothetical protein